MKRVMVYKVCYLTEEGREGCLFSTFSYVDASQFASKSDLEVDEVYIKPCWKRDSHVIPVPPVERIETPEVK